MSLCGFTCNCCARTRRLHGVSGGTLTFAGLAMRDRSRRVPVVTFFAVMTVPARRRMSALQTNASADAARQLVQLHVESALSRVEVAVAHWNRQHGNFSRRVRHEARRVLRSLFPLISCRPSSYPRDFFFALLVSRDIGAATIAAPIVVVIAPREINLFL